MIHSCGSLGEAIENYEKIMLGTPYHAAWITYMYNLALIENKQYEKAESFALSKLNEKLNWSGVDQTLYLQLAYLYEQKENKKKAKKSSSRINPLMEKVKRVKLFIKNILPLAIKLISMN
ncbi:hypothetical protein OA871_01245 [Paracoccaceae bacterium]|nr:hypothetical protein [Paracoccaceae bacterium]